MAQQGHAGERQGRLYGKVCHWSPRMKVNGEARILSSLLRAGLMTDTIFVSFSVSLTTLHSHIAKKVITRGPTGAPKIGFSKLDTMKKTTRWYGTMVASPEGYGKSMKPLFILDLASLRCRMSNALRRCKCLMAEQNGGAHGSGIVAETYINIS